MTAYLSVTCSVSRLQILGAAFCGCGRRRKKPHRGNPAAAHVAGGEAVAAFGAAGVMMTSLTLAGSR
jgi:hypothetical protein